MALDGDLVCSHEREIHFARSIFWVKPPPPEIWPSRLDLDLRTVALNFCFLFPTKEQMVARQGSEIERDCRSPLSGVHLSGRGALAVCREMFQYFRSGIIHLFFTPPAVHVKQRKSKGFF